MREIKVSRDELANAFQDYDLFEKTIEVKIMEPSYLQIIEKSNWRIAWNSRWLWNSTKID